MSGYITDGKIQSNLNNSLLNSCERGTKLCTIRKIISMFLNYLKAAWRNLLRNKASSSINICGLSIGMAVALLIGLWIYDELSFDRYHQHYNTIAQVMQNRTNSGEISTSEMIPLPLAVTLKKD